MATCMYAPFDRQNWIGQSSVRMRENSNSKMFFTSATTRDDNYNEGECIEVTTRTAASAYILLKMEVWKKDGSGSSWQQLVAISFFCSGNVEVP